MPDYQTPMLPLLRLVASRKEASVSDLRGALAREFGLTEEELAERIPSGRTTRFSDRVSWAATYFVKAGLVNRPRRAVLSISDRGRELLETNPSRIDNAVLSQFPEFVSFRDGSALSAGSGDSSSTVADVTVDAASENLTPRERIERSARERRAAVIDELLERARGVDPVQFERIVLRVLTALGYGGVEGAEHLGRTKDGGVDGRIREDPLGLEEIFVQAKRWENTASRPEVPAFTGSLEGFRARKGVFITTSDFSREARDYVAQIEKRIVLISGQELAAYMYDRGVGVATFDSIDLKSVDSDFFADDDA